MKVRTTDISGLLIIEPDMLADDRGYFFESFSEKKYSQIGIKEKFVQDNISKSVKNTIRGLHYQVGEHAQGKLCQVLLGEVLDIAVDIRFGSPTFGKYFSMILSEDNHLQLWVPPGFAHGFSVLSGEAVFSYKCTAHYNRESERVILYSDPTLAINWKNENPKLSEKDLKGKSFLEIEKDFVFNAG